jgi:hypothetical protein
VVVDGQAVHTWCVLNEGHASKHESPGPRVIEHNEFGPGQAAQRGWGR